QIDVHEHVRSKDITAIVGLESQRGRLSAGIERWEYAAADHRADRCRPTGHGHASDRARSNVGCFRAEDVRDDPDTTEIGDSKQLGASVNLLAGRNRSEERRVGKEGRSGGSP